MLSFASSSKQQSPLLAWNNDNSDNINILNLTYDITSPSFISCVISDMGLLPCTSVPVVLRLKNRDYAQLSGVKRVEKVSEQPQEVEVN